MRIDQRNTANSRRTRLRRPPHPNPLPVGARATASPPGASLPASPRRVPSPSPPRGEGARRADEGGGARGFAENSRIAWAIVAVVLLALVPVGATAGAGEPADRDSVQDVVF